MEMYFISMIRGFDKYGTNGNRCVGYFETFQEAEEAVINNDCDIYEAGYYPYAVIEGVKPGLYAISEKSFWYQYNKETKKYEKIKFPEILSHFMGFTIG